MAELIGQTDGSYGYNEKLEKDKDFWKRKRNFHMDFYVIASLGEPISDVKNAAGIPALGSINSGIVCADKTVTEGNPFNDGGTMKILYTVSVEFDSTAQPEEGETPLDFRPRTRFGYQQTEISVERDALDDNKPVANVNGEPLNLSRTRTLPTLTVTRYETWQNYAPKQMQYMDHVNSDTFLGTSAKKVLCTGIEAEGEYFDSDTGSVLYAHVTYSFLFDAETHISKLLNEGMTERRAAAQIPTAAKDDFGQPVTGPILLDANGVRIGSNAAPVFLEFNRYPTASFSGLGITLAELGF